MADGSWPGLGRIRALVCNAFLLPHSSSSVTCKTYRLRVFMIFGLLLPLFSSYTPHSLFWLATPLQCPHILSPLPRLTLFSLSSRFLVSRLCSRHSSTSTTTCPHCLSCLHVSCISAGRLSLPRLSVSLCFRCVIQHPSIRTSILAFRTSFIIVIIVIIIPSQSPFASIVVVVAIHMDVFLIYVLFWLFFLFPSTFLLSSSVVVFVYFDVSLAAFRCTSPSTSLLV